MTMSLHCKPGGRGGRARGDLGQLGAEVILLHLIAEMAQGDDRRPTEVAPSHLLGVLAGQLGRWAWCRARRSAGISWVPLSKVWSSPSFERMYWPGVAGPTSTSTMYREPSMGWAEVGRHEMRAQGVPSGQDQLAVAVGPALDGLP